MILFFYVILNGTALFLFTKIKKRLHILEIAVYWMLASYFLQNFSALCLLNFKTIIIPDRQSYEFAGYLNRSILYPVLMVTYLHVFLIISSSLIKFFLFIFSVFLLTGLEWLADYVGIFSHVQWQIWWSFLFWSTALTGLMAIMKFFRLKLYRGERRFY